MSSADELRRDDSSSH
jgi:hypothetical protein